MRPSTSARRQRPLTFPRFFPCSLADNQLCGVGMYGNGTYTAEAITKLCEALKSSAVTSLKCASPQLECYLVKAH